MSVQLVDPALVVVDTVSESLLAWFGADNVVYGPPKVGSAAAVHHFAGDALPLAAWDAHAASQNCNEPFVWVRQVRRFRTRAFPAAAIETECGLPRVVVIEMGVAWCAVTDAQPRLSDYVTEAEMSCDVAIRLEEAQCLAAALLRQHDADRHVGMDTLTPYGPEGGVIAWSTLMYATYSRE